MSSNSAYDFMMEKVANLPAIVGQAAGQAAKSPAATAGATSMLNKFLSHPQYMKNTALAVSTFAGISALSANVLSTIYRKIDNDTRRKAVIEDLAAHDPVLSQQDSDKLKEWYATMHYYAPSLTQDKATVREILTGFARFGKVDPQTIKLLVDTEEKVNKLKNDSFVGKMLPKLSV